MLNRAGVMFLSTCSCFIQLLGAGTCDTTLPVYTGASIKLFPNTTVGCIDSVYEVSVYVSRAEPKLIAFWKLKNSIIKLESIINEYSEKLFMDTERNIRLTDVNSSDAHVYTLLCGMGEGATKSCLKLTVLERICTVEEIKQLLAEFLKDYFETIFTVEHIQQWLPVFLKECLGSRYSELYPMIAATLVIVVIMAFGAMLLIIYKCCCFLLKIKRTRTPDPKPNRSNGELDPLITRTATKVRKFDKHQESNEGYELQNTRSQDIRMETKMWPPKGKTDHAFDECL